SVLALNGKGYVTGWGDDWQGESSGPTKLTDLVAVAAGESLSLGLTQDGQIRAWGWDIYDATTVPADMGEVVHFSASYYRGTATGTDGKLRVWGNGSYEVANVPPGLGPVQMAHGGNYHVVALVGSNAPDHFPLTRIRMVKGLPMNHQVSFVGTADRFSAMALPPGISFDTITGTFSGTPTEAGRFNVRVTAEKGFSRVTRIIPFDSGLPRNFGEWRAVHLGSTGNGAMDDPDGDSVPNLMEYALNRNPLAAEQGPLVSQDTVMANGQTHLALTYDRPKEITDVRWIVEVSSDLSSWSSGNPATATTSIVDQGNTLRVTTRDAAPLTGAVPRFIRLRVEKTTGN
ncbi:MAG: hypothetical protein EOP85_14510, partial [Verrucomicrobiaceae bacterium]